MHHSSTRARSTVRTLSQHEELPLLRDHLLRLDRAGRHDRFHGFIDDSFIEGYAEKCANDGTIVIAYFEDGVVRGAAELHPPEQSPDSLPEIAFSVEAPAWRRQLPVQAVDRGSARKGLPEAAHYHRRAECGNAGARQQVRRASDVQSGRIHRHDRCYQARSAAIGVRAVRIREHARGCTRDCGFQSRILADAVQNVWLGPGGLTHDACLSHSTDPSSGSERIKSWQSGPET